MANTLTLRSAGAITNLAQPTARKDKMINDGTIFGFDLAKPYCIDLAITPVDGALVKNLVSGGPDAILKVPTPGDLVAVAGRGLQLKATANLGRVQIGTGTQYFQTNLTHDFALWTWDTFPASDPGGGHIGMIFSKGATASLFSVMGPWLAFRYTGSGGLPDLAGKFDSSTGNGNTLNAANTEPDPASPAGLHQFGMAKVGSNILFFRDGVQVGVALARNTPDLTANSNTLDWGNKSANEVAPRGMMLHRFFGEDLTVSGKTAAAQIAADYAANTGKYV
jgi:hypothetical protein